MKPALHAQGSLDFGPEFKLKPVRGHSPTNNKLGTEDRAFHDWYRFVLSFPPHLVRTYLDEFNVTPQSLVLDPFCGTGTTLVECKLHGIPSAGIEANPFPRFASSVKTDWRVNPAELLETAQEISNKARTILAAEGIDDDAQHEINDLDSLRRLPDEAEKLLLKNSISPVPLHKTLLLVNLIEEASDTEVYNHLRLALANALVTRISNLKFGPEVGVGKLKIDAPVISTWLSEVERYASDLETVDGQISIKSNAFLGDSRQVLEFLPGASIDAVITSPPYPNEKDYTRTTRLESVLLGFISSKQELRNYKQTLLRSNTRGVYKKDNDDEWIHNNKRIASIADRIEAKRIELGKTSGFERLYPRVTRLYFGGMARHFEALKRVLKPGARLAYVVGDQASYLRVMIRTGELLAEITKEMGYEVERIDLFRERFATATGQMLREEVLVLRWQGPK